MAKPVLSEQEVNTIKERVTYFCHHCVTICMLHLKYIYILVVYTWRLQVPMKMRRWSLMVNFTGSSQGQLYWSFVLTWTCEIDH